MDPSKTHRKRKAVAEFFRVSKRTHKSSESTSDSGTSADIQSTIPSGSGSERNALGGASIAGLALPTASTGERPDNVRSTADKGMTPSEKAWNGFKAILPIVEKVSVVFPPLQSAVGGLIGIISKFDTCKANAEKVEALAQTLDQLQRILVAYPDMMKEKQVRQLEYIQRIFEEAQATVKTQNEKPYLARLMHGMDDQSKLVDSMGKLTRFVNLLELEVLGQTGFDVKELHHYIKFEKLLDRLGHLPSASFSGADRGIQTRVECTPGTRTRVLEMLMEWTLDSTGTPFFWLNGMAGTGKSTIAQSLCNRLHADGRLAASFFCSRSAGGGQNDASKIAPTIAFQLAYHFKGFMKRVCDLLTQIPNIVTQSIEQQLQKLFWEPLDNALVASEVPSSGEVPLIVVIDGLDECSDVGAQRFVEALLRRFQRDLPVHLRFLLFSRSERHIGIPIKESGVDVARFELHDIPQSDVSHDIRVHVEASMAEMSSRKSWGNSWYTEDDIHFIVVQADVLFIYAATVLRYLENSKFRPEKRLQTLRRLELTAKTTKTDALRPLHLLYSIILENLGEADDLEDFEVDLIRKILFILAHLPTPLPIPTIADMLDSELDEVRACISSLSSVVRQPAEISEPVTVLHASFPEFIRSPSKLLPAHLHLDVAVFHCLFLIRCLAILNGRLREGLLGTEVDRRAFRDTVSRDTLSTLISPALRYAAQYWPYHSMEANLEDPVSSSAVFISMSTFMSLHLLHWVECLAWTMNLDTIQSYLTKFRTHDLLSRSMPPEFGHVFNDILQLIKRDSDTLHRFPGEIYYNALIWLPKTSCEPLCHERNRRPLPTVERGLPEHWSVQPYQTSENDKQKVIIGSLITLEERSLAWWLSISDQGEITVHEWDITTDVETQYPMGHLANTHVISKVASNGVFFFDPKEWTCSFKPLNHSTVSQQQPHTKTWDLHTLELPKSDQQMELTVSVNGKYAALWGKGQSWVFLIDVSLDTVHRMSLAYSLRPASLPIVLSVCFSTNETDMAVITSDAIPGPGTLPTVRVFKTADQTTQFCWQYFFRRNVCHFYFSPDSQYLSMREGITQVDSTSTLYRYNAETGEMLDKGNDYDLPHFNPQIIHFVAGIGIHGYQYDDTVMFRGEEMLCQIPTSLTWEEQAQIGGSHMFLASAKHGLIVLKVPRRPHVDDAHSLDIGYLSASS